MLADTSPTGLDESGEAIEEVTVTATRLPNWVLIAALVTVIFFSLKSR